MKDNLISASELILKLKSVSQEYFCLAAVEHAITECRDYSGRVAGYQPTSTNNSIPPNVTSGVQKPFTEKEYLRPCLIKGEKAYFHKWVEKDIAIFNQLSAEQLRELHKEGFMNNVCALLTTGGFIPNHIQAEKYHIIGGLVEYESGNVEIVSPSKIQFTDTDINAKAAAAVKAFYEKAEG